MIQRGSPDLPNTDKRRGRGDERQLPAKAADQLLADLGQQQRADAAHRTAGVSDHDTHTANRAVAGADRRRR